LSTRFYPADFKKVSESVAVLFTHPIQAAQKVRLNPMSDEIEIKPSTLEAFLTSVIQLEKRYAHNERGAKQERRSKVVERIEETAARELDKA
jgi:hypothetical protein